MIFYFKNSVLASIVSIFGCGFAMCGLALFADEPAGAVFMILLGVAMVLWGRNISKNKAFKTWWKQIEEKNNESPNELLFKLPRTCSLPLMFTTKIPRTAL